MWCDYISIIWDVAVRRGSKVDMITTGNDLIKYTW